jgi:NADPH:quinone reductase-like Zn-dependent oxidoreductase/acyl carrier protein
METAPEPSLSLDGQWLLLADRLGVADALAARIEAAGGRCVMASASAEEAQVSASRVSLDPRNPDHAFRLLGAFRDGALRGVVNCWPVDLSFDLDRITPDEALEIEGFGYGSALHLIRGVAQAASPPALFLVTKGGAPVAGTTGRPTYGCMSALRKTLQAEFPEVRCRVIDLDDAAAPEQGATALAAELQCADEPEVALRGQHRFAPRLERASRGGSAGCEDERIEFKPAASGLIDDLECIATPRVAPGPGEVEIEVRATGLNFRDVLNALNMLPGHPRRLGGECAGAVVRVGEASLFAPGEAVVAFCPGQSGSFVTVPERYVIRKPAGLGFAQAAALPIAYLTALYALCRLAKLQAGETILIHAAAGGLGLAATRVALSRGARVYATAGSEAKRDYVRALGAAAVMSSRTLDFADAVLTETGGHGVDVILNTLNGDFVPASFRVLRQGGRFLEAGKLGVFSPEEARAHRPDAAYHRFDLGEAADTEEALIPSLFQELVEHLQSGALTPLPVKPTPYADARRALREMAEARHIGKLVLMHPNAKPFRTRGGAWMITGGFGALGLRVADWLAGEGAETVVLVGRRRREQAAIAAIEARGTTVIAAEADCADVDALRAILSRLPPGQALRGVVHCAGVLADAILPRQLWSSFDEAARPKLGGAVALHEATLGLDLEAFVLFSSASATLGSAGQASYAAANAAMAGVAWARAARGLPALCIDWGPWSEGMAAHDRVRSRNLGLAPMDADAALATLAALMGRQAAHVAVLPVSDWSAFFKANAHAAADPFFTEFREAIEPDVGPARESAVERLGAMPEQARRRAMLQILWEQAATVLGADPLSPAAPETPLQELGLDSLMSVELRNLLMKTFGLSLPPTLALDYPTLDALQRHLLSKLFPSATENAPRDAAAEIASLSDEEAEALLLRELEELDV